MYPTCRGTRLNFEFHYDPSVKINPDTPTAWMTVAYAVLEMRDGVAHFFHDPDWRKPQLVSDGRP